MYRKNSNKGLISTICILLVIVLLVGFFGFVTSGFKNWDTKTWFEKENVEEPPAVDNEGNELEMGKVYSLPTSLMFRKTSTESLEESGITLQATILPTNATEKAVDWSVDWVENTGFAEGKNVSEYVTVTPSEDGSNVAVVNCLQAFGTQIKIVVISRENEDIKAECIVDFAQKVESIVCKFGNMNINLGSSTSFNWVVGSDSSSAVGGIVTVTVEKSAIYTIEDTFKTKVVLGDTTGATESQINEYRGTDNYPGFYFNDHTWFSIFDKIGITNYLGKTIKFDRQFLRACDFWYDTRTGSYHLNNNVSDSELNAYFLSTSIKHNTLGFVSVQVNGTYSSFASACLLKVSRFTSVDLFCKKCYSTNVYNTGEKPPQSNESYWQCRDCGYRWLRG